MNSTCFRSIAIENSRNTGEASILWGGRFRHMGLFERVARYCVVPPRKKAPGKRRGLELVIHFGGFSFR